MAAAVTDNEILAKMRFYTLEANDELWRECATWLTKWGIIRKDHRANWSSACIADLANMLRDGVLLCKLLNKIDPSSLDIRDVNLKPTLAQVDSLNYLKFFCVDLYIKGQCSKITYLKIIILSFTVFMFTKYQPVPENLPREFWFGPI